MEIRIERRDARERRHQECSFLCNPNDSLIFLTAVLSAFTFKIIFIMPICVFTAPANRMVLYHLYTVHPDQIRAIDLFLLIIPLCLGPTSSSLLDHKRHNWLLWDIHLTVLCNMKAHFFICLLALIYLPFVSPLSLPMLQSSVVHIQAVFALVSTWERAHTALTFLSLAHFI